MNLTKMYIFLFAIITAVIGSSTIQENKLAGTCWKVSWDNKELIGIEEIDSLGHLSNFSKLLEVAPCGSDTWALAPNKLADYDGKTPTVMYDEHSLQKIPRKCEINNAIGHYDSDNNIVWEKSWWRFTTWVRVGCLESQTENHNKKCTRSNSGKQTTFNGEKTGNRLIKTAEEEKAKVLKVGDRVQALKILNSASNHHIISKDEILIVFGRAHDKYKEQHILVKSENNNEIKYVLKQDYIYLKQLEPVKDANAWTGNSHEEIPEIGKILESSSSLDSNETNNSEDKKKYIIKEVEKKECCNCNIV